MAAGEAIPFTLTYAPSNLPPPDPTDPLAALERTEVFWREWSDRARIEEDERRAAVIRSLIGLFSEEYDVKNRRLVGNFPQAFSHVALINTAHNLTRSSKPAEHRAGGSKPGK